MRFVIAALGLALAGCTPSLQPLYTDQDTAFDPALLGVWHEADGKDSFTCSRLEASAYRMVHTDDAGTAGFTVRLVQLGTYRFVDLYPDEPAVPNGLYKGHLLRVHSFGRIWLEGDRMKVGMLDPDWLKANAGPALVMIGKDPVLTAGTAGLRAFAAKHAESGAFSAISTWVRER